MIMQTGRFSFTRKRCCYNPHKGLQREEYKYSLKLELFLKRIWALFEMLFKVMLKFISCSVSVTSAHGNESLQTPNYFLILQHFVPLVSMSESKIWIHYKKVVSIYGCVLDRKTSLYHHGVSFSTTNFEIMLTKNIFSVSLKYSIILELLNACTFWLRSTYIMRTNT